MTNWPPKVSSSPSFCIPEAPVDVHGHKLQPGLFHQRGSCLLVLDRKSPGYSPSVFTSEGIFPSPRRLSSITILTSSHQAADMYGGSFSSSVDLPLKGIWEHDLVSVRSAFDLFCSGSTEPL